MVSAKILQVVLSKFFLQVVYDSYIVYYYIVH